MSDAAPPELLAAKEVWAVLGIGRTYFLQLLKEGRIIRPVLVGKEPKWRRRELIDWIDSGCPDRDEWRWRPTLPVKLDGLIRARTEQLTELRAEIEELERRRDAGQTHTHVSRC